MDSKTRAQLKKQLTIFRKAKGKLSRYGHDTDSSNGQFTVHHLQHICKKCAFHGL